MTVKEAKAILEKNAGCAEDSLIDSLHECELFSKKRFWEFYDCVITLAQDALKSGRDFETARKITLVYQRILKEMVWHFDKRDLSKLRKFPNKRYNSYIERLDNAVDAYFRGVFVDETLFELQRPGG